VTGRCSPIPLGTATSRSSSTKRGTKRPISTTFGCAGPSSTGIDRETLAQTSSEGMATAADVMMGTFDPLYPRAERVIAKYAYDPARASALPQEAGWARRGGEGPVSNAGQPLILDIRTTQGRDNASMNVAAGDQCPTVERRFVGTNRGCWKNASSSWRPQRWTPKIRAPPPSRRCGL